LCLFYH